MEKKILSEITRIKEIMGIRMLNESVIPSTFVIKNNKISKWLDEVIGYVKVSGEINIADLKELLNNPDMLETIDNFPKHLMGGYDSINKLLNKGAKGSDQITDVDSYFKAFTRLEKEVDSDVIKDRDFIRATLRLLQDSTDENLITEIVNQLKVGRETKILFSTNPTKEGVGSMFHISDDSRLADELYNTLKKDLDKTLGSKVKKTVKVIKTVGKYTPMNILSRAAGKISPKSEKIVQFIGFVLFLDYFIPERSISLFTVFNSIFPSKLPDLNNLKQILNPTQDEDFNALLLNPVAGFLLAGDNFYEDIAKNIGTELGTFKDENWLSGSTQPSGNMTVDEDKIAEEVGKIPSRFGIAKMAQIYHQKNQRSLLRDLNLMKIQSEYLAGLARKTPGVRDVGLEVLVPIIKDKPQYLVGDKTGTENTVIDVTGDIINAWFTYPDKLPKETEDGVIYYRTCLKGPIKREKVIKFYTTNIRTQQDLDNLDPDVFNKTYGENIYKKKGTSGYCHEPQDIVEGDLTQNIQSAIENILGNPQEAINNLSN